MPAVRREGCGEHVVADDPVRLDPVIFTIQCRSVPNVVIGRFAPPVSPLGSKHQEVADDRRHVPCCERLIGQCDDRSKTIHRC